MTSGNGNGINGGVKSLVRQMTRTGERIAAWLFRLLIAALTVTLVIIGWFAIDKLSSFDKQFEKLESARATTWGAINELTRSQTQASNTTTRLETSLADYIKNQDRLLSQLAGEEADHEQRLRQLERPPLR